VTEDPRRDESLDARSVAKEISRLHRDHHGRGATTTRAVTDSNHLIVLLEDIYTPLERTLIESDNRELVKTSRQAFQMAMGPQFVDAVERITGRKVLAFMSQVHFDPDLAAEIFVLAPKG
jgi:uncharacterized protein YbcI